MYSKSSRRLLPSGVWSIAIFRVVAVKAHGSVGPLAAHRVTTNNSQTEVDEERDRGLDITDRDADVSIFMGTRCTLRVDIIQN
jgi:hypothetical protein